MVVPSGTGPRIAQSMTPEERLATDSMDVARQKDLAAQTGLEHHHVALILGHFAEVRELARAYQRANLLGRFRLLMQEEPLMQWLKLRFSRRKQGITRNE